MSLTIGNTGRVKDFTHRVFVSKPIEMFSSTWIEEYALMLQNEYGRNNQQSFSYANKENL